MSAAGNPKHAHSVEAALHASDFARSSYMESKVSGNGGLAVASSARARSLAVVFSLLISALLGLNATLPQAAAVEYGSSESACIAAQYSGSAVEANGDFESDGGVAQAAQAASETPEVDANVVETSNDDEGNSLSPSLKTLVGDTIGGIPLYSIVAIAIVVVAMFFFVSTRKMNDGITKMNRKIK